MPPCMTDFPHQQTERAQTLTVEQHRERAAMDCRRLRRVLPAQLDRLGVQPSIRSLHPLLGTDG